MFEKERYRYVDLRYSINLVKKKDFKKEMTKILHNEMW